jgi:hypothetical protein
VTEIDQRINIPDGFVLRKIGGRPKNTARDIAIFLARHWRTGHLEELVKQADAWILDRWSKDGISESAHIRRSLGKARDDMDKNMLTFSDKFAVALKAPIAEGSPGWFWCEGMTKALPIQTSNFSAKVVQEVVNMKPIALASRQFFNQ